MTSHSLQSLQRRAFMKRVAQVGSLGMAAPFALNLAALGDACALEANDYKAMICVFLYGGNDNGNTVIPIDNANYAEYSMMRGGTGNGGIALPQEILAATSLQNPLAGPNNLALSPGMTAFKTEFDAQRLAVLLNIGPLVVPTNAQQFSRNQVPTPPKLFSHNDQQSIWQSHLPEGSTIGWGGRIGDLALAANGQSLFTSISLDGNTVFSVGEQTIGYQANGNGASQRFFDVGQTQQYGSSAAAALLTELLTKQGSEHLMEKDYIGVANRSRAAESSISTVMQSTQAQFTGNGSFAANFPNTSLGNQLRTVARIIAGRDNFGVKRQVFFVGIGGFDQHDFLLRDHANLLKRVVDAMAGFQKTMNEMNLAQQVTVFTASEFGRTLSSNGDGSDHGWGGHHFVLGGAVKGKRIIGQMPRFVNDDPQMLSSGRYVPTLAHDQLIATLGTWFGLNASELSLVAPNLNNFSVKNLGLFG